MVEDEYMMWCKEEKRKVALGDQKDLGGGIYNKAEDSGKGTENSWKPLFLIGGGRWGLEGLEPPQYSEGGG